MDGDSLFGDAAAQSEVDVHANGDAATEDSESGTDTDDSVVPSLPPKMTREPRNKAAPAQPATKKQAAAKATDSRRKQKAGGGKSMSVHDRKKAAVAARQQPQKGSGRQGKVKGKAVKSLTEVVKRSRYCFGVRANREVMKAMKASALKASRSSHTFLIPEAPVRRIINETVADVCAARGLDTFRVNKKARYLLHYALEDFHRGEFSKANMMAMQANRMTIYPEDFTRVKEVEQNGRDGFVFMNLVGKDNRKARKRQHA